MSDTLKESHGRLPRRPGSLFRSGRSDSLSDSREGSDAYVLLVFLLALVARVVTVVHQAPVFLGPGMLFDQLGLRIYQGYGFGPTSMIPPLYPHYLAALYQVYGYSHYAVVFSNALIGAFSAIFVILLVRAIGLGRRYAVIAGILFALFPQALAQTRHLQPQLLVGFLMLLGTFFWIRRRPTPTTWESILAGIAFGLAILGRSGMILPILFLVFARGALPFGRFRTFHRSLGSTALAQTALTHSELPYTAPSHNTTGPTRTYGFWRWAWVQRMVLLLTLCAVIGPWIYRNYQVHQRPVWVDSSWALRIRAVTIPDAQEVEYTIPGRATTEPNNILLTDNRLAIADLIGYTITYPREVASLWGYRLSRLFGFSGWNDAATFDRFPYEGIWYRIAQAIFFQCLLALTIVWFVLLRARGSQERVLAWGIVGYICLALVAGGIGDGRLFLMPLLVALAMRGAWALLVLSRTRLRTGGSVDAVPPIGVSRAGKIRWLSLWIVMIAVWLHGVWFMAP